MASTGDYLSINDPIERIAARMDVIEAEIGRTAETGKLRRELEAWKKS